MIGYEQWRKDKNFWQRSDTFAADMRQREREEKAQIGNACAQRHFVNLHGRASGATCQGYGCLVTGGHCNPGSLPECPKRAASPRTPHEK